MDLITPEVLVQVWGLHRSGTNFVEYILRNNIRNNNYERREVRSQFHGKRDALKHTYPDITKAKYHICIYKNEEQLIESHDRYGMKKLINPKDDYYTWVKLATEFKNNYPNRVALINYNDFLGKELYYFREWNWDIEYNDVWQVPIKRMSKESGTTFE